MKRLVRTLGALALAAALVIAGMAGTALAQSEGPVDCYPIPPGGCPDPEPDCDALLAAVEAGQITEDQLPEECRPDEEIEPDCPELLEQVEAGTLDPGELPPGCQPPPPPDEEVEPSPDCDDLRADVEAGTLDAAELPAECQVADTGAPAALIATGATALVGLGGAALALGRRRTTGALEDGQEG